MALAHLTAEHVALGLTATAIVAAAILPPAGPPDRSGPAPLVDAATVQTALTSRVPESPTLEDEITHFERRLDLRGEEAFSRRRLLSAHLLRFRAYGRSDDLDHSLRHFAVLDAGRRTEPDLEATRASLALAQHDFPTAVDAAERADRLARGSDPDTRLTLFDALWAVGEHERAAAHLEGRWDRSSVGWLSRKARVLDRKGRVEDARDAFRIVLEQVRAFAQPAPVEAWALVELGHFETHAGDPATGVARYLEALEVLPGSPAALEGLAAVAAGVDRRPQTAELLYRAALERGAHLDAMLDLADAQEAAGDEAAAERTRSDFLARATATPDAVRTHRQGIARNLADRDDEGSRCAALDYARAELGNRRDASTWATLARVRYRLGHLEAAAQAARRAVAWGSPEPAVAFDAGVALSAVGDEEATVLLREALAGSAELTTEQVERVKVRLAATRTPAAPERVECGAGAARL